uniref:Acetyl-coenzyme A carboxylase carboxyl transferase subunit beta, chloroplastic n=1 Tax=Medicago sativa subsp. falcata TaxID=3878 RepID=A0A1J0I0G4_MEDSF|nr:acetyl-CoA carboxylase beta subunit [Medicago sativa subsp. falcata]APC60483.1 acetyl-CoA carboxylase beta subunit [Medicago sativa subsp. falcata]
MEKWWFNSMMFNRGLEYRCGLSKSIDSFGPIENNSVNEDPSILTDMDNTIHSDYDYLVDVRVGKTIVRILVIAMNIRNFLSDKTFLVRDSNSYSIYNWNNIINSCIEGYLRSEIGIDNSIFDDSNDSDSDNDSDKYNDSDWDNDSGNDSGNDSDSDNDSGNDSGNDSDKVDTNDFSHLWVACDSCYGNNYKRFFKSKMNICEYCGCHLKMSSSDRIELLIDPGTWNPMDEDMVSVDPIEFNSSEDEPSENSSEDEPSENDDYQNRLDSYQDRTGLLEAVQTGTGQVNGIPVAIGIMDFQFMGGSMGSVVGEKITRLIEYATNQRLPLIIVCASGGARMQEGSLSLMQMAKISSALYNYQINQKLFYVPILTSPTTGGVTASFGMLGDIIIAEPDAYIAFAGKRVIEQTLNIEVPEGSQSAEFLFEKGLFDSIVPRNSLKEVLSELLHFHGFFPLTQTEN